MADKILILEPNSSGHHFLYVRLLIEECIQRGLTAVLVSTQGASETPEFKVHLSALSNSFDLDESSADAKACCKVALEHLATAGVNHFVVPDADQLLRQPHFWRKATSTATGQALLMRAPLRPDSGWNARSFGVQTAKLFLLALSLIAARGKARILVLQPTVNDVLPLLVRVLPKVGAVPDPITMRYTVKDRGLLRARLGLDASRHYVGIMGGISARKNPQLVAAAVAHLSVSMPIELLLVGRVDDDLELSAQGDHPAVRNVDHYLDDDDFDAYLASLDCLVCAHSNDAPSGLVGKALAAGVPLVVAGSPLLQKQICGRGNCFSAELTVPSLEARIFEAVSVDMGAVPEASDSASIFVARLLARQSTDD